MSTRLLGFGAAILSIELVASPASAQVRTQRGFAIDRFEAADPGSEWFVLDPLDLRGTKRLSALGMVNTWDYKALVAYDAAGNPQASLIRHQVFVTPGASFVMWDRARVSLSVPIGVFENGQTVILKDVRYKAPWGALGDTRLAIDARLYGRYRGVFTAALGAAVYFPTGLRDSYTSDGTLRLAPRATVAGDVKYFTYSARTGFHYRPLTETFERNPLGSELFADAAAGLRLVDGHLVVGPEAFGSTITNSDSFFKRRGTPFEALLGAHYTLNDFRFGAGLGHGITRGWGTPVLRTFMSAEWTPAFDDDSDHDGVPNGDDACPTAPGPRTNDKKTNGCPPIAAPPPPPAPTVDRDGDGVLDREDACPDIPGVHTPDAKTNGCPPDRDHDGVYDLVDVCPDLPGPKSDDPKRNGCPVDRDGDSIPDDKDACPDLPGEPNTDPTANGCPLDHDGDGVYDKEDACPDAPGPADPDSKRNGCPLARIEGGQIKILDQVHFKVDSAEILRDSDATLVAVAMTMKSHPEIAKIQIEGYTDNRGIPAHNFDLSYKRAAAVQGWLAKFGIDKSRMDAKGFGPNRPIDTNSTDAGRQNNRRVELHILELNQGASPKLKP
jgi:outer membrane protein OmpA-like peptidoglycan-associated protein